MEIDFTGQVIAITGGAGTIGRATASAFLESGARKVVLIDNDENAIGSAVQEFNGRFPGRVSAEKADLRILKEARDAVRKIVDTDGTIDVLFNHAGVNRRKPAVEVTEEDWDFVLGVNLKGLFFISQEAGRHMLARGRGAIINTASVSSVRAHPNFALYASSKGGLAQLTRVLANEWAPHGVRVNAVAPGYVDTGLTKNYLVDAGVRDSILGKIPLKRLGEPKEMAAAVLFLASDHARYITGEILFVDGGRTLD